MISKAKLKISAATSNTVFHFDAVLDTNLKGAFNMIRACCGARQGKTDTRKRHPKMGQTVPIRLVSQKKIELWIPNKLNTGSPEGGDVFPATFISKVQEI